MATTGELRRAYRVTGRVQGVGFRWWAWRTAQELGLRGTVRNCRDGSVEVQAAGPAAAVARMRERLSEGPPGAVVQAVEEQSETDGPLPEGFEIVH